MRSRRVFATIYTAVALSGAAALSASAAPPLGPCESQAGYAVCASADSAGSVAMLVDAYTDVFNDLLESMQHGGPLPA